MNKNVSFNGYIPVEFYARYPKTGEYMRVLKPQNIRKCQSFVVRNLNGTAKKMKNDKFVNFYSGFDKDYLANKQVKSIYNQESPNLIMVTGDDVNVTNELAKPLGRAKADAKAKTGRSVSKITREVGLKYFENVSNYLKNHGKRIKGYEGENLILKVFFEPKYNKKNELKGFTYTSARFSAEG